MRRPSLARPGPRFGKAPGAESYTYTYTYSYSYS